MTKMKFAVKMMDGVYAYVFNARSDETPIFAELPLYGYEQTYAGAMNVLKSILNWQFPGIDFSGMNFRRIADEKSPDARNGCERFIEWQTV